MHLLGECSESTRFGAMAPQFWPSSGQKTLKIGQNGGFRPLSEKVFMQSNSNLVCALVVWVFQIDSLLGHVGQIFGPLVAPNYGKWWFPTINWKSVHSIQLKVAVYTYWVSVQIWFAYGPRWQILAL